MSNSYLCLCDIPLFSGLKKDTFHIICNACSKRVIKKGEAIFCQGDAAETVYIVKEGSFKLVHNTEEGSEAILDIACAGDVLGETALFSKGKNQSATAVALEESRVCSIDRSTFETIIKTDPEFAWQMIENLSVRLYTAREQITESNTKKANEKVLNLLMRLANEHGTICPDGLLIEIPLTQQEIASMVGISRVMVSQVLQQLIRQDYLLKNKKNYIIKNRCF